MSTRTFFLTILTTAGATWAALQPFLGMADAAGLGK